MLRRVALAPIVAALAVAALVAAMPAYAGKPAHAVRDLHYGDVLFNFYQQKYFSAITRLLAAKQQQHLRQNGDEAELLLGGMYLSYGMHRDAEPIFEKLIAANTPKAVQDRAWFYLAKIRYQRGMMADAAQMLARIHGDLPRELDAERRVLTGLIATQQERYDDAIAALKPLRGNSGWALYARYNLGVALARAGRTGDGMELLEQVGLDPERKDDEEAQSLRDKANVALGLLCLRENQASRARAYLDAVRLDGPLSSRALLASGWADMGHGNARDALAPWTELTRRDRADTAVQEAWLAIPYAFGKLGAYRQSLEQYEQAIVALRGETVRLDEAVAAVHAGRLVNGLLEQNPQEEMGWFWRVREMPDAPETRYLVDLLATHEFNEALKVYRDLRFLESNLESWAKNVEIFDAMLANRRARYNDVLPRVERELARHDVPALKARRDALAAELAEIESSRDVAALATPAELARLQRIGRIAEYAKRAVLGEAKPLNEKLRRLLGLQTWDIWSAYPARRWQVRKSLNAAEQAFAEAEAHQAAVVTAKAGARSSFEGFGERVIGARERISQLRQATRTASIAQSHYLEELAVAELKQRRSRLVAYLTQAQFAVAQIYDKASSGDKTQ
jgi:hypothetical protein